MTHRAAGDRGELALVLHSHMPYVEGFGTWPFGEEWLWEAVATVYLPLLEVLGGAPVTVGLTPVLADQLETLTGPAGRRFLAFLREVRAPLFAEDAERFERHGDTVLAAELRRAAGDYVRAEERFTALGGDLLGAFGRLAGSGAVEVMTSAATHAVLPLLATEAGRRLQVRAGTAAHGRRFGPGSGAFWLPECAYEPGLERTLAEAGVRAFCVDQTDALGLGAAEQLEPVATAGGPVAVPIDWRTVRLVWDVVAGYPAHPTYRDYHRGTPGGAKPWATGGAPYDRAAALALATAHARDFVDRALARLDAYRAERGRPGLLCAALDAELLGHWWYEGPDWLTAVLREAGRRGLRLATLSDAVRRAEPVERPLAASSWGTPKDLSTWDRPAVAEVCFSARRRELELVSRVGGAGGAGLVRAASAAPTAAGGGPAAGAGRAAGGAAAGGEPAPGRPGGEPAPGRPADRPDRARAGALARAARELLALQSSDWPFQLTRALSADYPLERVRGHAARMDAALAALADSAPAPEPELRNLAPRLDLSPLLAP